MKLILVLACVLAPALADDDAVCYDSEFGAVDSSPWSQSCQSYYTYTSECGVYDDDDFSSLTMCCACGGGSTTAPPSVSPAPSPGPCFDTNSGAVSAYGYYGCSDSDGAS